ncbi:MAG: element excision factor XisH family protein [Bacteroidota bacterium]
MARDLIHHQVRRALEKEGWVITDDPFRLNANGVNLEIDIGAERVIAAQKGEEKIFIEIKTLNQRSILYAFYAAFGQYICYRDAIEENDMDNPLFLAIPLSAFKRIEENEFILNRLSKHGIRAVIVDTTSEKITKWIK